MRKLKKKVKMKNRPTYGHVFGSNGQNVGIQVFKNVDSTLFPFSLPPPFFSIQFLHVSTNLFNRITRD